MALLQTLGSASTSTSTSALNHQYHVFLNSGPDVGETLARHIYRHLVSYELLVFLDQREMQQGERLPPQVEGAIRTASIHVVIFSPGYSESKRFLDVLLLMIQSTAAIIPVYYNVQPCKLWWWGREGGKYAETLRNLETTYGSQTFENWRRALSFVANISGFDLEAYDEESELIERVVQCVVRKFFPTLNVAKYPSGLNEKLVDFENTVLLQQQEHIGSVKVVGIAGPGGIGKTTLVKELFNRHRSYYDRTSVLFDVRDHRGKGSLMSLQRTLVRDLTGDNLQINRIDEGVVCLAHHEGMEDMRALIIIDDVDDVDQLNAILPVKHVLNPLSLIVITTRDKDVLLSSGIPDSSIYKLKGLDREHSQELFCWHAFHQSHPVVGFEEVVDQFIDACNGLPLSLKVLGALLSGKDLRYWQEKLHEISKTDRDIVPRLRISYDSLDQEAKQIFLDIACFFLGKDRDKAIRIWNGAGWKGTLGLKQLVNRCLVEVDDKNCIRMHDHLRDLGRDLAEEEFQRRLWRPIDSCVLHNVFQNQTSVRGINVVQSSSGQALEDTAELGNRFFNFTLSNSFIDVGRRLINLAFNNGFVHMRNLQLLTAEGNCLGSISELLSHSDLLWLRWDSYPFNSLPLWIPKKELRVLEVVGGELETLWQTATEAPVQLRELNISATLLRVPKSIGQLRHLEKIEMEDTREPLPEEFFHLHSLKHLRLRTRMIMLPQSLGSLRNLRYFDLSGCTELQTLPSSLGDLANLNHFHLKGCFKLQMLPNSFGNLSRLHHLSLAGCTSLTISSITFGAIRTLENLHLSSCPGMGTLPPQVTGQGYLKEINLEDTNITELPMAIGNLSHLEILKLQCPRLEMLPSSLGKLTSLAELKLRFCEKLRSLPNSVGELTHLRTLSIHYALIEHLPVDVMRLNNLETLKVTSPLLEVPFGSVEKVGLLDSYIATSYMIKLRHLDLQGTRLKDLSFCEGVCPDLQHLNVSYCPELVVVGALPTALVSLDLQGCPALKEIKGLSRLAQLRLLDISECDKIEELQGLDTLGSVEELRAEGSNKVECIAKIRMLIKRKSRNYYDLPEGKKRKL